MLYLNLNTGEVLDHRVYTGRVALGMIEPSEWRGSWSTLEDAQEACEIANEHAEDCDGLFVPVDQGNHYTMGEIRQVELALREPGPLVVGLVRQSDVDARPHPLTQPTYIGGVNGVAFYEHPVFGDEAPLIVHHGGGWHSTVFYDLPDPEEFNDVREIMDKPARFLS